MTLKFTPLGGKPAPPEVVLETYMSRYKCTVYIHSSHKESIYHKFTREHLQFKIFRPPRLSFGLK